MDANFSFFLLASSSTVGIILVYLRRRHRARRALREAAAVLDPSVIETHRSRLDTETVQTRSIGNTLTQLSIENPVYRGNTRGYGFEFCMTETSILTLYLGQHLAFTIGAENTGTRLSKVLTGEDVMVGDPEFDAQVSLQGNEADILPYMDRITRSRILAALEINAHVSLDSIRVNLGRLESDSKVLIDAVETMILLADALNRPSGSTRAKMAEIARTDDLPTRVRYYTYLLDTASKVPLVHELTRDLLTDEEPKMRMLAGQSAGIDGVDTLLDLARDSEHSLSLRCDALKASMPYLSKRSDDLEIIENWILYGDEPQVLCRP